MISYQSIDDAAHRRNLRILIALRAAAFCAQAGLIAYAAYGLGIVLPVTAMLTVASSLILFNLWAVWRLRQPAPVQDSHLFAGLVLDVVVLAIQFGFSGATSNPLVSFFMLPVILGAVMLSPLRAWLIYTLTLLAYAGLAVIAAQQKMPMIMDMPDMKSAQDAPLIDMSDLHMNGMMLGYAICAGALVGLIARIRHNLRQRDRELAELRAQTQEQEHILRLGLLTAGAAHELGTPLTTLSVILKDWQDLSPPQDKHEREADIATMRAQVERCKMIISDILAASGRLRGEGAERANLAEFVNAVADRWQVMRPHALLRREIAPDDTIIAADRVLEQVLHNLLDNAVEASGVDVVLRASIVADDVVLAVVDDGEGFTPEVLAALGRPYISTKAGDTPRGLGLFLAANTARALGGRLNARNRVDGGADVALTLPLSALKLI